MPRCFVFCILFFLSSLAGANDVVIGGQWVPSQLLKQLVCSSNDDLRALLQQGQIQTHDEKGLWDTRTVVIANLLSPDWTPRHSLEQDDYCVLTGVLADRNSDCGEVSLERLKKLETQFCQFTIY